jgi:hypothetical protein
MELIGILHDAEAGMLAFFGDLIGWGESWGEINIPPGAFQPVGVSQVSPEFLGMIVIFKAWPIST